MHKIGARLLGKLTICIDNAGPLWGYCIVAIRSTVRDFTVCLNTQYFSNIRDDLLPGYFQILISVQARGCEAVALASHGRFCNCSRQSNNWRKHIFMQASGLLEPRGAGGSRPRFLADHYQYLNPGGQIMPTK